MSLIFALFFDFIVPFGVFSLLTNPLNGIFFIGIYSLFTFMCLPRRTIHGVLLISFLLGLFFSLLRPEALIFIQKSFFIYSILFISSAWSLVTKNYFIGEYVGLTVSKIFLENKLFQDINKKLTWIWTGIFLVALMLSLENIFGKEGIFLAHISCGIGGIISAILPAILQKKALFPKVPKELKWEITSDEIIFIGSGIASLVAALEAQSLGYKVTIFESNVFLGGCLTNYKRLGKYTFGAGVESISGLKKGILKNFLEKYNLTHKISWIQRKYAIKNQKGEMIYIPQNDKDWSTDLQSRYPEEKENIRLFFEDIQCAFVQMYSVFETGELFPCLPQTKKEMNTFVQNNPLFFHYMDKSWKYVLDRYFQNPELRQELTLLSTYVSDEGEDMEAASMIPLYGYFFHGGYLPQGGSQKLVDVIVQKLLENGAIIKKAEKVEKILIENNHVVGVKTQKGAYETRQVVSGVDPRTTYEYLVGMEHLSKKYQKQVQHLKHNLNLTLFHAVIDTSIDFQPILGYMLQKEIFFRGKKISKFGINFPSAIDTSVCPAGQSIVSLVFELPIFCDELELLTPKEYEALKKEGDDLCRNLLFQVFPETKDKIIYSEVSTARTNKKFLGTYNGSSYNIRKTHNPFFPAGKSPITGLYLVGAGVGYGPGVEASMISGAEIKKFLSPRKK